MLFIRQNSTDKVVIGPVVAVGDGFTPVTTLVLTGAGAADEAEAILHNNGTVVDISAYTFAAIAVADGYYHLTLAAGISGTVGHMTVVINDDSLCLPVRADFLVLPANVYDSLVLGTDLIDVNTAQWLGTAVELGYSSSLPKVDGTGAMGLAYCVVESTGALSETCIELGTMTPAYRDANASVLAFVGGMLHFLTGDCAGESQRIITFNGQGSGHWDITVASAFSTTPSATDKCLLIPAVSVSKLVDNVITAAAINAAAIDNAALAADIGTTVYASNKIALAVRKALDEIKLDHLLAVADADDVVDNAALAKLASTDGNWSNFVDTTDSLQSIRDALVAGIIKALADDGGKLKRRKDK